MELFTKLFGKLLVFVYHCFDRIVIHGYLSGLSRPEQVVYFFRKVLGVATVGKDVLGEHIVTVDGVDPGVVDDATRPRIRTVQPMPGEGLPT